MSRLIRIRSLATLMWWVALCACAWVQARTRQPGPLSSADFAAGERLYRQGLLPSGAAVSGEREAAQAVAGSDAACVNCHRRSGLGSMEGTISIPPITGPYLFRRVLHDPAGKGAAPAQGQTHGRGAYTDATLARAIRDGIGPDGHLLDYLMPRYRLDDEAMTSLIVYLKRLSSLPLLGVSGDDVLDFATITTPDADPVKRAGVLDVLGKMFLIDPPLHRDSSDPDSLRSIGRSAGRTWVLHVWDLTGSSETWEQQLYERQRTQPVFAVISGVGGKTWAPVHRFCERESIPCLMPVADLPVVAENDFYSIYFSKGVLLEAELVSKHAREYVPTLHRIIQVFRADDIGADAASALRAALAGTRVEIVNRILGKGATGQALTAALDGVGEGDALVLWLRPSDLAALPARIAADGLVFASGIMGGLEHAPLPAPWRKVTWLTYPFELPEVRSIRMNYPLGWFRIRQISVVDERAQTDAYLASVILSDLLLSMHGNFVRDYLVEQAESLLDHRLVNGYYPRLGLAPGQRFASKGGYLVRFSESTGTRLAVVSDWTAP